MMNLKEGDKVLLYSMEECRVQPWFICKANGYFDVIEWLGFEQCELGIVHPMFSMLGNEVTIVYLHNNHFMIKNEYWNWSYKLIKNKL